MSESSADMRTVGAIELSQEANNALESWGVSMQSAQDMADAAAALAAGRGYVLRIRPEISIDADAQVVWCLLPLGAGYNEIRELSLAYEEVLFSSMPDAPIRHLHVGFLGDRDIFADIAEGFEYLSAARKEKQAIQAAFIESCKTRGLTPHEALREASFLPLDLKPTDIKVTKWPRFR